ncbi:arylsulfatase [Marinobacterium sediminicola]|uniref:Arylsulfatase n=1 Tax=Marinobacterium sediminicola TaxID=518898 RepID=A0ABY1S3C1_9GAMM|nr:arylsulfatase [Marinobacterium sediminicola]ULG68259.1 arylsulfatase [Marinobacterium sediminicola]SMR77771.1 arylsulfatase [Marinobacterium sediminicola]
MKSRLSILRKTAAAALLTSASLASAAEKPNILLIVADDLGYSDIGAFGGEIETPNLDELASSGIRLTDFHTAPTCSPTRSMLLSGTDSHQAGLGNMAELLQPEQKGKPGYEGYLNTAVATLPEVLRDNGYNTYMVGKWHLGRSEDKSPASRGFDKSFALIQGGASHFDDQRAIIGKDPKAIYRDNGKSVELPKGFFSTDYYTDLMMQYIDEDLDENKPFFAYVAYTAPHWPLQAPEAYLKKYEGKYEQGYEQVRQARLKRMQAMGIIDASVTAHTPLTQLPRWEELTDEQRRFEARRMEIYAAMVDNMDHNIGRLIDWLDTKGELDNTVIMFMSDNGADGNSPEVLPGNKAWFASEYDNSFENLGRPNSYVWYGAQWGQVSATPFPLFKGFPSQGGLVTPAIVRLPGEQPAGQINQSFIHVKDVMPTFLELAGIKDVSSPYNGREVLPIQGRSMLPLLKGDQAEERAIGWELFGRSAVRKGDWKIRLLEPPYGDGEWQLFNLKNDPTERHNLAWQEPEKLAELLTDWEAYVRDNGVFPSDPEKMKKIGYSFTTCVFGRCVE